MDSEKCSLLLGNQHDLYCILSRLPQGFVNSMRVRSSQVRQQPVRGSKSKNTDNHGGKSIYSK
eukprot:scaffold877_cov154-Amphora_coffeaeformis.AAC.8